MASSMDFYTCVGVTNKTTQDILVVAFFRELPPKTYLVPASSYRQVDSYSARTRWLHFEVRWLDLPGTPTADVRLPDLSLETPRIAFAILSSVVLKIKWTDFDKSSRGSFINRMLGMVEVDYDELAAARLGCTIECLQAGSSNACVPAESGGSQGQRVVLRTTVQPEDTPQRLADRLACSADDLQLVYGDSVNTVGIQLGWPLGKLRKREESGGTTVVRSGEGYWHVAQRLGCGWDELARAEGYRVLKAGDEVEWPHRDDGSLLQVYNGDELLQDLRRRLVPSVGRLLEFLSHTKSRRVHVEL
jgi:hypothetical protein